MIVPDFLHRYYICGFRLRAMPKNESWLFPVWTFYSGSLLHGLVKMSVFGNTLIQWGLILTHFIYKNFMSYQARFWEFGQAWIWRMGSPFYHTHPQTQPLRSSCLLAHLEFTVNECHSSVLPTWHKLVLSRKWNFNWEKPFNRIAWRQIYRVFSWLTMSVRETSALWAVPPQGSWSWAV